MSASTRVNATTIDSCQACVNLGHTYCRAEDFFGGKSKCVADSTSGFFGDCSDIEFGSANLQSDLDCTFNTENGEIVLVAIILAALLVLGVVYRRVKGKTNQSKPPVNRILQMQTQMQTQMQPQQPQIVMQPQMVVQPQMVQPQGYQPQGYPPQGYQPQGYPPQQGRVLGFGGQTPQYGAGPIAQAVPVQPMMPISIPVAQTL